MRVLPLLLCLALGACVTDGKEVPGEARASAAPVAAKPEKPDKPEPAAKPKEWWEEGPVTRERASAMCWMKIEKAFKGASLDKRADQVNKCVDQALKEHGS